MWNTPTDEMLQALPTIVELDDIPVGEQIVHLHFYMANLEWYITAYDPKRREFFGYSLDNQHPEYTEWTLINFDDLISLKIRGLNVSRDVHWKRASAKTIDKIVDTSIT